MNAAGLELLKHFEGCKLTAYPDPGTGAEPWTIGFGCTKGVKQGDVITQEVAESLLLHEVVEFERGVRALLKRPVNENQLAALVCFAYNVGLGNLKNSTLLKLLNAGAADITVADQFPRWNRAAGKIMRGLTLRREAERRLFLGEDWR